MILAEILYSLSLRYVVEYYIDIIAYIHCFIHNDITTWMIFEKQVNLAKLTVLCATWIYVIVMPDSE